MPAPMIELLSKDQFINALPDEEMRVRIHQSRPATLRGALEIALELESYQLASRHRTRLVRGVKSLEPASEDLQESLITQLLELL